MTKIEDSGEFYEQNNSDTPIWKYGVLFMRFTKYGFRKNIDVNLDFWKYMLYNTNIAKYIT